MTKLYATAAERAADMPKTTGKVSCLGPAGSYSELAASVLCEGKELVLCRSFSEAVARLLALETDYAVLPVENSLNGGVLPVLDLLAEKNIYGDDEYLLHIDHRLALREGTRPEDIEAVCSHEQALAQCEEYLRTKFPNARLIATASTAESLERIDAHTAGIVGSHIHRAGIVLSAENIADNKQNFTRFLRVGREEPSFDRQSAMIFLCAVCAHRPGALLGLLKIFRGYGLNLTRIESRPLKETFGQYRFFIEFAGDVTADRVRAALEDVKGYCEDFKLIGAYM